MDFLVYLFSLIVLGSSIALLTGKCRKDKGILLIAFWFSIIGRTSMMIINEELGLFGEKGAFPYVVEWTEAFVRHVQYGSQRPALTDKFALQGILNVPVALLFGIDRINFLLTNIFIGSICPVMVFGYFRRFFHFRIALWGLVLFSVYPAAIIFSIFGIRDILLFFLVTVNCLSFLAILRKRQLPWSMLLQVVVYIASFVGVVILRTAMLGMLALMPMCLIVLEVIRVVRNFRSKEERVISSVLLGGVLSCILGLISIVVYTRALAGLTGSEFVTPRELMESYATSRFDRAFRGEGYGSQILSPETYHGIPVYYRYLLQVMGLIVIPMPWLLTSVMRLLVAMDSIFVILCLWWAYRMLSDNLESRVYENPRMILGILPLVFVTSVLSMGLLINNAGNAFRMRIAIVPFILIPAAIHLARQRERVHKRLAV